MTWNPGLPEFSTSLIKGVDANRTIAVLGPTGSGKSSVALSIASELNGEIVNCDSVQCVSELIIGSAKPSPKHLSQIPHHGYDLVKLGEEFDAGRYKKWALNVIEEIRTNDRRAVVCGGTGLYFRALTGENFHSQLPDADPAIRESLLKLSSIELRNKLINLDPDRADQLHPNDRVRHERAVEISMITGKTLSQIQLENQHEPLDKSLLPFIIILDPPREILLSRIETRIESMMQNGFVEEVEGLLKGATSKQKAQLSKAVGYKEVVRYIESTSRSFKDTQELKEAILISTRQYAKRQKTWFQKVDADIRISSGF